MPLSLGAVLTAARDRHWAFSPERIPNAVIARYLSDAQNELIAKAARRDPQFLAQTAVVSLAASRANTPGVAGAGTSGGLPGVVWDDDSFSTSDSAAGSLIEVAVTEDRGATVHLADATISSLTATTLTKTGAGRDVNGDVGKLIVITAGPGLGQRREVISNTADTWTFAAFDDTPDVDASLFSLVTPLVYSDEAAGVVTALPATSETVGYLVKLDSDGLPYIDYTQPVGATLEQGVPLPPFAKLLPHLSQYWTTDGCGPRPLAVINAVDRFAIGTRPAVYTIGSTLYGVGATDEWNGVASLELRYTPIAPAFTALTDLFLLPDHARPVLVALAGAFCAMRVQGMPDVAMDAAPHAVEADRAERDFLRAVLSGTRGRSPSRVREMW